MGLFRRFYAYGKFLWKHGHHMFNHNKYDRDWKRLYPESAIWHGMLQRCQNPKRPNYYGYGGRGIEVRYASYADFLVDVGSRPSVNHSIDRINNSGHYEKGNCRWATRSEQQRNTEKFRNRSTPAERQRRFRSRKKLKETGY